MIARLQALKGDLQKRCLVLDEEEVKVCAQLMSIFPDYTTESVSAVVAMHSRDLVGNSDELMSVCVNFILDESNPSVREFLVDETFNDTPSSSMADEKSSMGDTESKLVQNLWRPRNFWESDDTCSNNSSSRSESPSLLCLANKSGHVEDSSLSFPSITPEAASWSNEDSSPKCQEVVSPASSCDVAHYLKEDLSTNSSADLLLPAATEDSVATLKETKADTQATDSPSSSSSPTHFSSSSSIASLAFQTKEQKPAELKYGWRIVSPPSSPNGNDVETILDHDDGTSTSSEGTDQLSNQQSRFAISNGTEPERLTSVLNVVNEKGAEHETESESSSTQPPFSLLSEKGSANFSDTQQSTELGASMQVKCDNQSRQLHPSVSYRAAKERDGREGLEQCFASTFTGLQYASNRVPVNTMTDSSESDDDDSDSEQLLPSVIAPRRRSIGQNFLSPAKKFSVSVLPGSGTVLSSSSFSQQSKTEGIIYLGKNSSLAYSDDQAVSQKTVSDPKSYLSVEAASGQLQSNTLFNRSDLEDSKLRSLLAISALEEKGANRFGPGGPFMSRPTATATQTSGSSDSGPDTVQRQDNLSARSLKSVSHVQALTNSSPTIYASARSLQGSVTRVSATASSPSGLVSLLPRPSGSVTTVSTAASSPTGLVSLLPRPPESVTTVSTAARSRSGLVSLLPRPPESVTTVSTAASSPSGLVSLFPRPSGLVTTVSTAASTPDGFVSLLARPPEPAQTQTYTTPVLSLGSGTMFPAGVTARIQSVSSLSSHDAPSFMNNKAEKSYHWLSSPLTSSVPGLSSGVNITSAHSTHSPVPNPQGQPLLVYPHLSAGGQGAKPLVPSFQLGHSRQDLASRSMVNSAHFSSHLVSPGSAGLTSVQPNLFTVSATPAGVQYAVKGKVNDGASASMAGASTSTSMGAGGRLAAVNNNSCATKGKGQFDEEDVWKYRDYRTSPDVVVLTDDSFNDSQESVQIVEISQGNMNNPAILQSTIAPSVHPELELGVTSILEVFPDVEVTYVRDMLKRSVDEGNILDHAVNYTLNQLLETPDFPRQMLFEETQSKAPKKDFFNDYRYPEIVPSSPQVNETWDVLSSEFRLIGRNEIKQVLCKYNYHYAPAYKCLSEAMGTFVEISNRSSPSSSPREITVICHEGKENEWKGKFRLLKKPRTRTRQSKDCMQDLCPELREEIEFILEYQKQQKEESDHQMAWQLLEKEYEEEGQTIECGCCFTQFPFEKLVQCFDGHLFCCDCLQGYAREAVFGAGKLNLSCMTEGCETTFPKSQLIKALSDDVMQKYDERLAEESLNMAAMSDLVRCPHCSLAAVLDASQKVFKCPGPSCQKETCRDCKEDWEDHRGRTCEEVEKKDETKLRREYEEKMTSLRVRTCPSCRAQFFKEEGCNKMTCRCGATMCYICRQPLINYKHFCQHPRDPGRGCTECNACSLWTNPDEDEKRALAEMQKEAQLKRREQGFYGDKIIGAPDEPPAKKQKS